LSFSLIFPILLFFHFPAKNPPRKKTDTSPQAKGPK
jgi:hypothetical protein